MDAALELFAIKGFRNVSMHQIAQKAEFAIGTLYKFFKNKEDLYRAMVRQQGELFYEHIMQAVAAGDDEIEKLRSFIRTKGSLFRANAAMIRIYFSETHGARPNVTAGFDREMRGKHEEFRQLLAGIFESGMKKGRFQRIATPYHLAVALEGYTNAFLFLWLEEPERYPFPEDPEIILNILFKGLLAP